MGRTLELKGIFSRLTVTNRITGNKTNKSQYTGSVKFPKKQACRPGRGLTKSPVLGAKQRDGSRSFGRAPITHPRRRKAPLPDPAGKLELVLRVVSRGH